MHADEFTRAFEASAQAMERLHRYEVLLRDWQQRMNLVGPATLEDIWGRHFADSAQLVKIVPRGTSWLDIGAGGGFPGMVLAALDWGQFTLVDSVAKKCRFLEAVRDALDVNVTIINARVELLTSLGVEIVTARAAAPLETLFDWGLKHLAQGGRFVLLKGRRWEAEVAAADARYRFEMEAHPSMTDADARILVARGVRRR